MTETKNPWDYMGAEERRILGDIVADPQEQARWCKAMVFGTLPYMWRDKASVVRELAYDKMELTPGSRVLLIGECLREIGFIESVKARADITNRKAELMVAQASGDQAKIGAAYKANSDANLFISSVNAITEDGKLLVADASGTRVAAFINNKVAVVVGANKIVKDEAAAEKRLVEYVVPIEGAHMRAVFGYPGTMIANKVWINTLGYGAGRIQIILVKESLGY